MTQVHNSPKAWYKNDLVIVLMAFAIPLAIRAIPEILMGAYVTGFDTMGHYVPTILLWLSGKMDVETILGTAPLFYSIVVLLVSSGAAITAVLKVLSVLLMGFLGLSVFGFAKKGLGWSSYKSLAVALLGTLYFVSLRISWDMLRNELAIILLFVVLLLLNVEKSFSKPINRYALLSVTMCLLVFAHQMVSVIMFGIIALTMIYDYFKSKRGEITKLLITSVPALVIFLGLFYLSPEVSEFRIIFGFSQNDGWLAIFGYPSYSALLTSLAGFFVFCFLPILPFIIIGARRLRNFQLYAWVLLGFIGALIPLVSPSNLRWVMMLTYPFAFFVVEALSQLRLVSWKRLRISLRKVAAVYLIVMVAVLSFGFILMPPSSPLPYFDANVYNGYVYQMPTSMLQNTVSITDCQGTVTALQWLKGNMTNNDVLLSHRAFYGWALSALNSDQIILYEYDSPTNAAQTAAQAAHGQIYLIWWVDGQGWYGQPTVPSSFHEVYQSGEIAIYKYF